MSRPPFALALAVALPLGCAHAKIANTSIDDTPENRAVLEVVESYRQAFQSRDAGALLALVSPRYYEDNGNTDRADDYDREGLKAELAREFDQTKALQLDVKINDIAVEEDQARAFAYVEYTIRAHNKFPSGERWQTDSDRARITLEREGDKWLIVSGI